MYVYPILSFVTFHGSVILVNSRVSAVVRLDRHSVKCQLFQGKQTSQAFGLDELHLDFLYGTNVLLRNNDVVFYLVMTETFGLSVGRKKTWNILEQQSFYIFIY